MNSKLIPAVFVSLLLFLPFVAASTVTRTLPQTALPGETVPVTLDVSITGGEAFYILDDAVPAGWSIIDPDPETQAGHVKVAVIQNAASKTYTYEARAPVSEGTYSFSGIYMFQGMTTEGTIAGDSTVTVVSAAFKPGFDALVAPIIIISALVLSVMLYKARVMKSKPQPAQPEKPQPEHEKEKPALEKSKKKKHV